MCQVKYERRRPLRAIGIWKDHHWLIIDEVNEGLPALINRKCIIPQHGNTSKLCKRNPKYNRYDGRFSNIQHTQQIQHHKIFACFITKAFHKWFILSVLYSVFCFIFATSFNSHCFDSYCYFQFQFLNDLVTSSHSVQRVMSIAFENKMHKMFCLTINIIFSIDEILRTANDGQR